MGQAFMINRTDFTAPDLRALAVRTSDGAAVRRLLALALLLEGHSREAAAAMNGMTPAVLILLRGRFFWVGQTGLPGFGIPLGCPGESQMQQCPDNPRWPAFWGFPWRPIADSLPACQSRIASSLPSAAAVRPCRGNG